MPVPNWTKVQDGEVVFVPPSKENPLGFSPRQLACVGLPCPYCNNKMEYTHGKRMPTREHFYPRSRYKSLYHGVKGQKQFSTIMVCYSCNNHKRDHDFNDWVKRHNIKTDRPLFDLAEGLKNGYYRIACTHEVSMFMNMGDDPRGVIGLPFRPV